ncbi:MAG: tetratricopeptide repeat protein [Thermodesulfobacteriota bacterium]
MLLISGIEKGLNLQEKEAYAQFKKAIELNRVKPLSYSFLAMAYLFFYETSFTEKEKKETEAALLRTVREAEKTAEKEIEESPSKAESYLALAITKMVKNRYEILQKNYFRAFREAQSVYRTLEKIQELDAQNYEVYYLLGVLHYHLGHLPGLARFLSSLFITAADQEKGIQELETAAAKSFFMRDLARANLVSIYGGYEKKYAKALPLAQALKEKYPQNYNFTFALANIFSELGQFAAAFGQAKEIEENLRALHSPYRPELWPRYYQLLGKIYFDQGHYEQAREYFNLALKDQAFYNARVRAWALVRLGMIHDVQKQRKLAEEYYQKALEVEGAEGLAQRTAQEYLNTPYVFSPKK